MKIYSAIYIGTYEITLKVFQISRDRKPKEIDCQKMHTEIARDLYHQHRITAETAEKLYETLARMKETIAMYRSDRSSVYAGYTLGQAENILFVTDQIHQRTRLKVNILSNSEQRFLSYQAAAAGESFERMTKSALLVDIGGYSLQMTLFRDGELITTQHILLGAVNIREYMKSLSQKADYREQISEMISKELDAFSNMYLRGEAPEYLILMNDQIYSFLRQAVHGSDSSVLERKHYLKLINRLSKENFYHVLPEGERIEDQEEMFSPLLLLLQTVSNKLDFQYVCFPNASVTDGIIWHEALNDRMATIRHDFNKDVLSAAWSIAHRYGSYEPHLQVLCQLGTQIFDTIRKISGLTKRDRLLYEVTAILHDCGKYISLAEAGHSSFNIIMLSEILGLTHKERMMVAYTALFNRNEILPLSEMDPELSEENYLTILKLLAILRVSNALDRSHQQKFRDVKMRLNDRKLIIRIEAERSISLEMGLFENHANYFEDVFSVRPVIREKKTL